MAHAPRSAEGTLTVAQTPGAYNNSLDFYRLLARYGYVACPSGQGVDSHRVWEALYLGVTPIVIASSLAPLYDQLPVIQARPPLRPPESPPRPAVVVGGGLVRRGDTNAPQRSRQRSVVAAAAVEQMGGAA